MTKPTKLMKKKLTKGTAGIGIAFASAVAAVPMQALAQDMTSETSETSSEHQASGRVITQSQTYNADGTASTKTEYEYDAQGNLVRRVTSGYGSSSSELTVLEIAEFSYDQDGRLLSDSLMKPHATSGEMVVTEKASYTYDDAGVKTRHTNVIRELSSDGLVEHYYDVRGDETECIVKKYESASWTVQESTKYVHQYISYGEFIDKTNLQANDNVVVHYVENGRVDRCNYMLLDESRNLDTKRCEKYTYDESGNRTSVTIDAIDSETGNLVETERHDYSYDASGNMISEVVSVRDEETGKLKVASRKDCTYDESGNVTSEETLVVGIKHEWTEGTANLRYEYEYDEAGRVISKTGVSVDYYGEETLATKEETKYDVLGNVAEVVVSEYDGKNWVNKSKTEYGFGINGEGGDKVCYEMEDGKWKAVSYSGSDGFYRLQGSDNVSNCEVYSWDDSAKELALVDMYSYKLDENGRVIVVYVWHDASESFVEKYKYSYDENGKSTKTYWADVNPDKLDTYVGDEHGNAALYQSYSWDGENDKWVLETQKKYEYEYDSDGNKTKQTEYSWHEQSQTWIVTEVLTYDADGKSNEINSASFTSGLLYQYTYNENGKYTLFERYYWNAESAKWDLKYRDVREYDSEGKRLIKDTVYEWHEASQSFVVTEAIEYDENGAPIKYVSAQLNSNTLQQDTYDQNNNPILLELFKWNAENSEWVLVETHDYVYECDKFGNKTGYLIYSSQAVGVYGGRGYKIVAEQIDDNTIEWVHYDFNIKTRAFDIKTEDKDTLRLVGDTQVLETAPSSGLKFVYEYDAEGNKTKQTEYVWHEASQTWFVYKDYSYDSAGKKTLRFQTSIYSDNSRYEYSYDEHGNEVSSTSYDWDSENSQWVQTYANKTSYEYDGEGRMTSMTRYLWSTWCEAWYVYYKLVYGENGSYKAEGGSTYRVNGIPYLTIIKHDENGNETLAQRFRRNIEKGEWELEVQIKYEHVFDEHNYVVFEEEYQSYDSAGESWTLTGQRKASAEYDADGFMIKDTTYVWHKPSQTWIPNLVNVYSKEDSEAKLVAYEAEVNSESMTQTTYDENGNVTLQEEYTWDGSTQSWLLTAGTRLTTTYDEQGKIVNIRTDSYAYPNQLVGNSKTETSFAADGKVLEVKTYTWDIDEDYQLTSQTKYTYDEDGSPLRIDNYVSEGGELKLQTSTVNTLKTLDEATNALPMVQEDGVVLQDNRVYDLAGRYVGTSTEQLRPGLYIRGGRLVRVR